MDLERIKTVVKWLIGAGYANNQKEIGELLGYTNESSFSQILNGKKSLPNSFVNRLLAIDDNLSKEWLLTGKGEMLKPLPTSSSNLLVGDGNKNVQLGHGSNSMHVADGASQQNIITELEKKILYLEGELKAKDREIDGLQKQLISKTELITILQELNNKK